MFITNLHSCLNLTINLICTCYCTYTLLSIIKKLLHKADLLAGDPTENKFSTSQILLGMFIHSVMLSLL